MKKSVLLVGFAFGIACAVCIALYASMVQQEADSARAEAMERYGGEQVEVLVATKDIFPGETLTSSNTTMKTWLTAGMLVDVYATGSETARIGDGLLVLATNVEASEGGNAKVSWVTLAVPLEQSQEFVTASQSMEIYFTLPSSEETLDNSDGSEDASEAQQ